MSTVEVLEHDPIWVDLTPPDERDVDWDELGTDPYLSAPARDLADTAPTPKALLTQARHARKRREDAERDALEIALEWAHSHPVLVKNGKPGKAWEADKRRSCSPDAVLMRDALIAHHRLSKIWSQLRTGGAQARQVRKISERMVGQPADVCEAVDAALAPHLRSYGPVTIDRKIDEILQRIHVEPRELGLEEEKEKRDVVLDDSQVELTGNAFLGATGDYHDLTAFERMVARVAEILKQQGSTDSLGVRRARAVGILADPHLAAASGSIPTASCTTATDSARGTSATSEHHCDDRHHARRLLVRDPTPLP